MHFKFQAWDYLNKFKVGFDDRSKGFKIISCSDPFILKIMMNHFPKDKINARYFYPVEIDQKFIDENFLNLNFFSETTDLIIFNADEIKKSILENLLLQKDYSDSFVFLLFNRLKKEELDLFKKTEIDSYQIEELKFWEGPRLLNFLAQEMNIKIKSNVVQFLLEHCEHDTESFVRALQVIRLNFDQTEIDLILLKKLIGIDRFDFFGELEEYHKNEKIFFKDVLKKDGDFDWLRNFSVSMQNHLIKVLNPEEISKKDKLSKYDQNVLLWSEQSDRQYLKSDLEFFVRLEIEAKKRNVLYKNMIRLRSL